MNMKNLLLCLIMLLTTLYVAAQEAEDGVQQRYDRAYEEYRNGLFDIRER